MELTDAEIGKITAGGGLSVGSSFSGSMEVNGLTLLSTDAVATMTLKATKSTKTVSFTNTRSTFQGLIAQAAEGINVASGIHILTLSSTLSAGSGTLTVATGKAVTAADQFLTISADELDLQGTITSGTATTAIGTTTANTLGVGGSTQQFDVPTHTKITAVGFTVCSTTTGNVVISGVSVSTLTGMVTVVAAADEATVTFDTSHCTFQGLAAQARRGTPPSAPRP